MCDRHLHSESQHTSAFTTPNNSTSSHNMWDMRDKETETRYKWNKIQVKKPFSINATNGCLPRKSFTDVEIQIQCLTCEAIQAVHITETGSNSNSPKRWHTCNKVKQACSKFSLTRRIMFSIEYEMFFHLRSDEGVGQCKTKEPKIGKLIWKCRDVFLHKEYLYLNGKTNQSN